MKLKNCFVFERDAVSTGFCVTLLESVRDGNGRVCARPSKSPTAIAAYQAVGRLQAKAAAAHQQVSQVKHQARFELEKSRRDQQKELAAAKEAGKMEVHAYSYIERTRAGGWKQEGTQTCRGLTNELACRKTCSIYKRYVSRPARSKPYFALIGGIFSHQTL